MCGALLVASARAAGLVGTGNAAACSGDCDHSGDATVNELISMEPTGQDL